jgi:hypothetical protein
MSDRPLTSWKYSRWAYVAVVVSWTIYAALTLFAPAAANTRYHMSTMDLVLLRLTVIVPIHLVWLVAVRGAVAFKSYAEIIKGSPEADEINQIANGLLWTIAYLVSISLVGSIEPLFYHTHFFNAAIILRDHIPPLIALVGFLKLYFGSHKLRTVANFTTWTRSTVIVLIAFGLFVASFVLEFASTPVNSTALTVTRNSTSLLPLGLLLFTLVMPYVIGWFMGVLASINILKFSHSVKGILYRKALGNLVRGIATIVIFAIAIQLTTFADRFLTNLSIGLVLVVVYGLIALYALGFVFIWMGAKQLERLEGTE